MLFPDMDNRICIDQHGRCSLEPGYVTLGIWNVATRNKAEAWRPLGYIPNLYLFPRMRISLG
jgi:hypothetical protein